MLGVAESVYVPRGWFGRPRKVRRPSRTFTFLDWAVDAVPLLTRLTDASDEAYLRSRWITPLIPGHPDVLSQIHLLLHGGGTSLGDGRIALLVCGECSDLWCGTISTRVVRTVDTVRWLGMAFQTPKRPPERFEPAIDFDFDRKQYETVLLDLQARFSAPVER